MANAAVRRILVSTKDVPKIALDYLAQSCELVIVNGDPNRSNILQTTREAASKPGGLSGILWWCKVRLDDEVLDAAGPTMRVVASMSAGFELLDLDTMRKRGIRVGNAPNIQNDTVATIAVALVLSATRRFHEGRLYIEDGIGTWKRDASYSPKLLLGQDIAGSTVGIVGLGGIGSAVARKLRAFDVARIVYSGRTDKPNAKELGAERVSFPELLRVSDIVVVTCPLTEETKEMFNAEAFRQMKRTATFVNVGRGQVFDQDALVDALKTGEIFAAGLDVVYPEPLPQGHPLLKLPNAVVLPHIGSATVRTREAMAMFAARNLLAGLKGEPMLSEL